MIRKTVWYTGRVQGVGFRYTARQVAQDFSITGYVKNLPDGRVEAVIEGEEGEVERFAKAIIEEMGTHIRSTELQAAPATNEFRGFEIRF